MVVVTGRGRCESPRGGYSLPDPLFLGSAVVGWFGSKIYDATSLVVVVLYRLIYPFLFSGRFNDDDD